MLTGAVSGVIFAGVGALGLSGMPQFLAHTVAGAVSGAANAAIMGGDIGRGALIGGASAGAANLIGNYVPFLQDTGSYLANVTRRASIGAIVGGSVSAATGGSFGRGAAQGAMTSAIAYTANEWRHRLTGVSAKVRNMSTSEIESELTRTNALIGSTGNVTEYNGALAREYYYRQSQLNLAVDGAKNLAGALFDNFAGGPVVQGWETINTYVTFETGKSIPSHIYGYMQNPKNVQNKYPTKFQAEFGKGVE